jgi:hypothetical protein
MAAAGLALPEKSGAVSAAGATQVIIIIIIIAMVD